MSGILKKVFCSDTILNAYISGAKRKMLINIAVVEDEKEAYLKLETLLKRFLNEAKTTGIIKYYNDPITFIKEYKGDVDLVFMDIDMPKMNGLDASQQLRKIDKNVLLVFITDLAQYAIKGYSVDSLDYIVKPVVYEHLSFVMNKALNILQSNKKETKLILKSKEGLSIVTSNDIKYIEVQGHKMIVHTINGVFTATGTMGEYVKNLPSDSFIKCNNCYLVNLKYVQFVDKYDVVLGKDEIVQMSHPRKRQFMEALTVYIGKRL